jgi:four helix bundle protein
MKVQSYKELNVWTKGLEIADAVYALTEKFPRKEIFGLGSQMERAATSISSNIAEGFMRQSTKEFIQFLHISLGSSAELETQLVIALKRNYVVLKAFEALQKEIDAEGRMLRALIKSLKKRLN